MALKTSCHKSKISQPPDIKNVNILFLIQLPAHEANRWAYYWVQGGQENCITEEALFVQESLASSLFEDQPGPFLSSQAQLSAWEEQG